MSKTAGVVNREGLADDAAFEQLLSETSDEVAEVARAVRRLVYEVLPATIEVVWPRQGSDGASASESSASSSRT